MPSSVVPVYVHLPLDVVEAVEAVAREERTTKSAVYRRVLRAWLDELNADCEPQTRPKPYRRS